MSVVHTCLFISMALAFIHCGSSHQIEITRPNIVYILADDLGIGDVSSFNPEGKIKTPHIDSLAETGMRFTDAHSPSAVCSPTRYGILTGRYAWRSQLKSGVTWSWDQPLIKDHQTTVASLLKDKGYETACVGKWHLGLGWQKDHNDVEDITLPITKGPNDLGFDYFFGITASLDIPPYIYIENDRSTTTQIDSVAKRDGKEFWRTGQMGSDFTHEGCLPMLTKKAVAFIHQQRAADTPFFLYFPLPAPHTPILPTSEFKGKSQTNEYGDFVLMVDDVVGQIKQALRQSDLVENTLIIFTSDNGCSPMANFTELATFDHRPSAIYRGHKADIYEGGHRVPFVASWPAVIPAGSVSNQTICLTDLMATCAHIVKDTLRDDEGVDSYNIYPLLEGQELEIREATVSHSVNGSYAIRKEDWKLIFCPGSGGWSDPVPKEAVIAGLPSLQLFDLKDDPGERKNLIENEPKITEELSALMEHYIEQGRSTIGKPQQNDEPTHLYFARDKLATVMAEQAKYLIHNK